MNEDYDDKFEEDASQGEIRKLGELSHQYTGRIGKVGVSQCFGVYTVYRM